MDESKIIALMEARKKSSLDATRRNNHQMDDNGNIASMEAKKYAG